MQVGSKRPPKRMRITLQSSLLLQPVQPVAESLNGAVVGILAIPTGELGQVEVNVGVGERATPDKWC